MPGDAGQHGAPGRRTSSRISSLVIEARRESLRWMSRVVKPGVSVGTTKPRTPSSVCAHTTATSAIPPLVIHIFVPLRTQSSPSRRARVRMFDRVGAEVGLGQPEAADRLARGHARQPRLLLLLAAVLPDREHRQRALHRHERAQAAVARLQLTAGHAVGGRARPGAPVALQVHPEQAELTDLRDELPREDPLVEPLPDLRQDPLAHPAADGVADHPLLVAQERVEVERVGRPQRRHQKSSGRAARAAASASSS